MSRIFYRRMRLWAFLGLAAAALPLSGCSILGAAAQRTMGTSMAPKYRGLAKHSVAIVVYADDSTTYEYPQARQEVSAFLAASLARHIPSARLLNYKDVIRYQDDTLNWQMLPVKTIGRHFGVARVIYIELLRYSSREAGASDLLRGQIKANCSVYDTHKPGEGPSWNGVLDVKWPRSGPEDVMQSNDDVVRMHALELFSKKLTRKFYGWRYYGPTMHR